MMDLQGGARKIVKTHPKSIKSILYDFEVMIHYFLWSTFFFFGSDGDWDAMFIGATDVHHIAFF